MLRSTFIALGLVLWASPVWARPILNVSFRLGTSISSNYWYVVALSDAANTPEANLVDPNINVGAGDVSFARGWDHLIRVKPANDEGLVESTVQARGGIEQEFTRGFNEVRVSQGIRPRDTINLVIDLTDLQGIDGNSRDVHVMLLTIPAPFAIDAEQTALALDATRGERPNFYRLSLTDQRQVRVDDPQRQETLRRSRDLIADQGGLQGDLLQGGTLDILAANIVTFELSLEDR